MTYFEKQSFSPVLIQVQGSLAIIQADTNHGQLFTRIWELETLQNKFDIFQENIKKMAHEVLFYGLCYKDKRFLCTC